MKKFDEALNDWIENLINIWNVEMNNNDTFSISKGKKYIKISRTQGKNSLSVHAFVDIDGNIYKPASWKAPAKGIRGNIFDDKKGLGALDDYGFVVSRR